MIEQYQVKLILDYEDRKKYALAGLLDWFENINPELHVINSYVVVSCHNAIVGVLSFNPDSSYAENSICINAVTTHYLYTHDGVATLMLTELFRYAFSQGKNIYVTPYTLSGRLYIKHVIARLKMKYPSVGVIERT